MSIISRLSVVAAVFCSVCTLVLLSGCDRTVNINDPDGALPPAVPQNVTITFANDGLIDIDWMPNPQVNLKGYNVYRSINDTLHLKFRAFTNHSYFTDDSLSYDSTYYYRVTTINTQNLESQMSGWIMAKPVNRYNPYTPQYLEINARNWDDTLSIYLKWKPNPEGDIAGYKIYRSENPQFNADTNSYLGFSSGYYFTDRKNLQLYKTYYYRIRAVDKAGLNSEQTAVVSDFILAKANTVFPANNSTVDYFSKFKIKTVGWPASYRIVLQTNQFFGEVWSKDFSSDAVNDTVSVDLDYSYIATGTTYYWRIITFSNGSSEPNSISNLFNFTIKP